MLKYNIQKEREIHKSRKRIKCYQRNGNVSSQQECLPRELYWHNLYLQQILQSVHCHLPGLSVSESLMCSSMDP